MNTFNLTAMTLIATGLNAFETETRPEGTVKFLLTPQQVIELVAAGKTHDFIILVRGGTATFLSPVLTAGTIGILTMSGAPESHLGILSREFQIPCVLTLAIEGWDRRYAPGTDRRLILPAHRRLTRRTARLYGL